MDYNTREDNRGNRKNDGGKKKHKDEDKYAVRDSRRSRERGGGRDQHDLDETPEKRLAGIIIMLGDNRKPGELHDHIQELSKTLQADYSKFSAVIIKTLESCIIELPMCASIYGTLVGLINVAQPDIAGEIVNSVSETLQECLNEGNWRGIKSCLRFFAELTNANVIQPNSLLNIYENLLRVLDESPVKKRRADTFMRIILPTLPYAGKRLKERVPAGLEQMLAKIQKYFVARLHQDDSADHRDYSTIMFHTVQPYLSDKAPYSQDEALICLWDEIQLLSQNDWECPIILKPWSNYGSVLITADQHDVNEFRVVDNSQQLNYLLPEPFFQIFSGISGQSYSDVPNIKSIEYFLINDMMQDIIDIFEINRKECVRYLKELPTKFAPGTFASGSTGDVGSKNFDVLSWQDQQDDDDDDFEKKGNNINWKLEKIIVEAIFSQIFKLPQSKYKLIYYHSLLTEACKMMKDTFPPVLGKAIGILFNRLESMDVECCYRFWNWFAHHLSNFGFIWNWKEWEDALHLDPLHPQLCFIRETLEKVIRYSYYERIKTTLPEEFMGMFPPVEPAANFRYQNTEHTLHEISVKLLNQLKTKSPDDQIQETLGQVPSLYPESSEAERENIIRDLLLQCLLMLGSKSFSHVLNVLERYLPILLPLNVTPKARLHTVKIVADFWTNNTQFLGILLDKLLNYRVIDAPAVISWLFSEELRKDFARSYVWEILKNTINKVNTRVLQMQDKLQSLRNYKEDTFGRTENTTEDALQSVESTLNLVLREQKEVLTAVLQKFAEVLTHKLAQYREQGIQDPMSQWWFWWAYGFFKEVGRAYTPQLSTFIVTLETVVLTPDVDSKIEKVVDIVKALSQE